MGLLESALARPENYYAYGEQDIFELAAAYAEGVARNRPFVDGDKRIAYATADFFLYQNGQDLGIKDAQTQTRFFENFSAGNVTHDAMAVFYRQNSRKRSGND